MKKVILGAGLILSFSACSQQPFQNQEALQVNLEGYKNQPGLQYEVVTAQGPIFQSANGLAEVGTQNPMTLETNLMAYSMSKVITAMTALKLVEQKKLDLEASVREILPWVNYPKSLKVKHLISQSSGVPNPIPLSWVHEPKNDDSFDSKATLQKILLENETLDFEPGSKYAYSNLSYWLLEEVIIQVTGLPFEQVVAQEFEQLAIGYKLEPPMARGYLYQYSWMNLLKGFVLEDQYRGGYEGDWYWVKPHYLHSKGMGGIITTSRAMGQFLSEFLNPNSTLFSSLLKDMALTPQLDLEGNPLPMTLGWHVKWQGDKVAYLYKEGGGAGFHCEMRLYPDEGIGTVVLANSSGFDVKKFLNKSDPLFFNKGTK